MTNVVLFSPNEGDGCSYYRGIGVFSHLRHYGINLIRPGNAVSWASVAEADVAYLQRPSSKKTLELVKMLKNMMPVWVDYDDDLLQVPESNPAYSAYSSKSTRDSIAEIVALADVATVSTPKLQETFVGARVIPNAYDDYRLPTDYAPKEHARKRVLWRGTGSHIGDLLAYQEQLRALIRDNPNVDFIFLGFLPWMLDTKAPNLFYMEPSDIFAYMKAIEKVSPDITIVPLEDNALNRAKSNIAWIETARYGAQCVAPNWEEWQCPGVNPYTDLMFYSEVDRTLEHSRTRAGWDSITKHLLLSDINQQRVDIIKGMCA